MVVGYQWFEVRVLWDRNLTISLGEREQRLQEYAMLLTQMEAVPPGFRTLAISGHTLSQSNQ